MTQPCKLHTKVFISESPQEESYEMTESLSRVIRKHTDIYIKKNFMQAGLNVLHSEIVSLIPRLLSKSYQEREYPSCFTRFKVPRIDNGSTPCPDQTHNLCFNTHEIGSFKFSTKYKYVRSNSEKEV